MTFAADKTVPMTVALDDFFKLRTRLPTIDVRSPGEFQAGHIPLVANIPILNNEERIAVGTAYKQRGRHEAIKTGFRLVGPRLEQIVGDVEKYSSGKEVVVHCWRGGMRSNNFCQFIAMAGIRSHQLAGGYKGYRQRALASYELPFQFMVIGGKTGSGKSEVLRALETKGEQILDLEKLANHKGSAFGGLMMGPQPTTEQFQNDLFEEILKLDIQKRIWVEDESLAIGKIFLPGTFWKTMRAGLVFEMEVAKDIRIQRLTNEYGQADPNEFLHSMEKIIKRLGGQHFLAAKEKLLAGDMPSTIDILLTYYDKAYTSALEKRGQIVQPAIPWNGVDSKECAGALIERANAVRP
jgi:tRNA 2-selenouridine synthase